MSLFTLETVILETAMLLCSHLSHCVFDLDVYLLNYVLDAYSVS